MFLIQYSVLPAFLKLLVIYFVGSQTVTLPHSFTFIVHILYIVFSGWLELRRRPLCFICSNDLYEEFVLFYHFVILWQ